MLLGEHGTMRLRDVLQYAIEYATGGYPIVAAISQAIAQVAPIFRSEWLESDRIYLTIVHKKFDADAFFPEISDKQWKETAREDHQPDEKNNLPYSFITIERR